MSKGSSFGVGFVLFAVVVVLASCGAKGVLGQPACAANLIPCATYLNATTKPPDSCCGPLQDAITNDLQCLCNLYADPSVFKTFNINMTQALGLPKLCGMTNSGLDACNTAPPPTAGGTSGTAGGTSGRTLFLSSTLILQHVLCNL
ncbi:hypothetical protein MRB53_003080 [Persea americana]|uniref:Uncharacterized protein n=1 Tax=Persea americana TaxID=3435 RepID=A0ACC2MYP4_PERAE|nr:hypothetical protein MRB53_003080 [Persea americana]